MADYTQYKITPFSLNYDMDWNNLAQKDLTR